MGLGLSSASCAESPPAPTAVATSRTNDRKTVPGTDEIGISFPQCWKQLQVDELSCGTPETLFPKPYPLAPGSRSSDFGTLQLQFMALLAALLRAATMFGQLSETHPKRTVHAGRRWLLRLRHSHPASGHRRCH